MVHQIIRILLLLICFSANAQQYLAKDGTITFFSKAPVEDISAINNKVSAVYDAKTKALVFQLNITDFIFPKSLMQTHFNENYLESDIYPKSTFVGKVTENKNGIASVEGKLTIHGETNFINVVGNLLVHENIVYISDVKFIVKLEDYKIKIPRIVMYNIAEQIEVKVNIKLQKQ
ncbi:uncharacterized protein METZ01_LOCUS226514 [marine metagenome]|uniref:Lipid/polyisoprenoid-binding YceI-like domain-containing protein n=1 Tax=marine metagenome TaxID=408172 RepID=A0A382GEM2_9ZZZZ